MPTSTRPRSRSLALPLALLLSLGPLLAACGGDAPTEAVASLGDRGGSQGEDGGGNGDSANPPTEEERQQAMLEFARCMREHGVDMADPQFDGEGRSSIIVGGAPGSGGAPPDAETMDAAQEACHPLIEDVISDGMRNMDPEEQQRMQEQALAFAKCMRENGVDMPDPLFEDGGRMTQRLTADADDATFQAAQEACAEEGGPFTIGAGAGASAGGDK